jgi:hypothetical protein
MFRVTQLNLLKLQMSLDHFLRLPVPTKTSSGPHTTLTKVSPDRCHSLAFGKTVHSEATVPITTAEQELGIV